MTSFKGGIVGGCRKGSWKAGASKLGAFHGRPGISIKISKYRHLRFFLGAQKKSKSYPQKSFDDRRGHAYTSASRLFSLKIAKSVRALGFKDILQAVLFEN
jgi:hypothetical protein